ncbi:TPA: helix-turn-helix domain-containing protein [Escherichia coli]
MASNYGENFTPLFKRFIKYIFKNPIAKTTTNKERFHLNLLEMTIYGEMASFNAAGCEIFISEQRLADDYDVSRPTVINSIKSLENAGLISIVKSKGKSNHYKLLITPDQLGKMCDEQGIKTSDSVGSSKEAPDNQQEAPKQATQQAKKAEVVQLPTQDTKAPQINAVSDKPRRGRPVKDVTDGGWIVLGESEAKERMRSLWESKYKGLNKRCPIRLSKIQEDFYTTEEVIRHKGTRDGEIWKPEEYWHLTRPVFIFANKLIGMGFEILLDQTYGDYPEILWRNVRKNKKGILEFR